MSYKLKVAYILSHIRNRPGPKHLPMSSDITRELTTLGAYKGNWKNGLPHGRGVYQYSNGDVFDGQWRYGKKDGRGMYRFASGTVFDGFWTNNKETRGVYSFYTYDTFNYDTATKSMRDAVAAAAPFCRHAPVSQEVRRPYRYLIDDEPFIETSAKFFGQEKWAKARRIFVVMKIVDSWTQTTYAPGGAGAKSAADEFKRARVACGR